ncbi:MTH1187 family thiamine-binding protein [Peptococcus niger]|uniref:Uncharacterized protein, MTH1187 family n=1 Tax=Peptococcus niger TaxID=2741 RepID=A0A1G6UAA7_PEPNI|nr:MTH1187 family thiamine-binding protein [Peptococcus niger]SDD38221.1 uncharacterized protein, MTH1187 family [Peptococcus niger]
MTIAELTLIPIGGESSSCSKYVAGALDALVDFPSLEYRLNPMGTVLEGPMDDILAAIKAMRETVFDKGVPRVYMVIKIDERRDKDNHMDEKLASVADKRQNDHYIE